ncbi:MAG: hypothetical protein ACRECL_02590 [Bradyrhizobium sp.]
MNSSVYSADRATHLRVVVVALMTSIGIVGFAISARSPSAAIDAPRTSAGEIHQADASHARPTFPIRLARLS